MHSMDSGINNTLDGRFQVTWRRQYLGFLPLEQTQFTPDPEAKVRLHADLILFPGAPSSAAEDLEAGVRQGTEAAPLPFPSVNRLTVVGKCILHPIVLGQLRLRLLRKQAKTASDRLRSAARKRWPAGQILPAKVFRWPAKNFTNASVQNLFSASFHTGPPTGLYCRLLLSTQHTLIYLNLAQWHVELEFARKCCEIWPVVGKVCGPLW